MEIKIVGKLCTDNKQIHQIQFHLQHFFHISNHLQVSLTRYVIESRYCMKLHQHHDQQVYQVDSGQATFVVIIRYSSKHQ